MYPIPVNNFERIETSERHNLRPTNPRTRWLETEKKRLDNILLALKNIGRFFSIGLALDCDGRRFQYY